uniref:Uncharacterized protein n=1 Tax=Laticauda laticaudata TaxID=8630 RepID=A0A8C5SHW4_LATLA
MSTIGICNCPFVKCYSYTGVPGQFPNSLIQPGSPFPVKTNDPKVQRAARLGVYKYNNSSNDIFLFKESHINKATMQSNFLNGLPKYKMQTEIKKNRKLRGGEEKRKKSVKRGKAPISSLAQYKIILQVQFFTFIQYLQAISITTNQRWYSADSDQFFRIGSGNFE